MTYVLQTQKFLSEREVAALLNVSHRTLQTWRVNGAGPLFVKLVGTVRYRAGDLDTFIAASIPTPASTQEDEK